MIILFDFRCGRQGMSPAPPPPPACSSNGGETSIHSFTIPSIYPSIHLSTHPSTIPLIHQIAFIHALHPALYEATEKEKIICCSGDPILNRPHTYFPTSFSFPKLPHFSSLLLRAGAGFILSHHPKKIAL